MSKTIVTHSGAFHVDDVFAVATLLLMYPDARIIRSRDVSVMKSADIVVDVGQVYDPSCLRFDHHQEEGAGVRKNGIPYAAFGLVWKEFGTWLTGSEEGKNIVDEKLVMAIDAHDNGLAVATPIFPGVRRYDIGDYIYSFLDTRKPTEEYLYQTFIKVVGIAGELLSREINRTTENIRGMEKVRKLVAECEDKSIVVLHEDLSWEAVLAPIPEAMYVVYPRKEGNWGAKGVPVQAGGLERKKLFPLSWAGKDGAELASMTGVKDAVFCHKGRFFASATTKESALALAKLALNA